MQISKIKPAFLLFATFVLAALVMASFETVKELIFHGTLTPWQSHIITIFVTATIATGLAAWAYRWVALLQLQASAASDKQQKHEALELVAVGLRESDKQFRTLIEAIPDAIFLKDGEGRWLVMNEPAKRLFQLHDIPWYGKTDMELAELRPEFRAAHEACLLGDNKAWESGELYTVYETVVGEDNQPRDF